MGDIDGGAGDAADTSDSGTDGGAPDLAGALSLWSMDGHDSHRRAQVAVPGPTRMVSQKWQSSTQVNGYVVPRIDSGGNIFEQFMPPVGIGVLDATNGMVLRSNGQLWTNMVMGKDGTVFLVPTISKLSAVDPMTLSSKWTITLSDAAGMPSAIASDGSIIVMGSKEVALINPTNGTPHWSQPFPVDVVKNPQVGFALGTDDAVIAVDGTHCASLDPVDGHSRWNVTGAHKINYAPVVGMDGTIYLVEGDGGGEVYLTALNAADGSVRWNVDQMTIQRSGPPAVGSDGTVLMLTPASYQALTPDGTPKWTVPVNAANFSTQPSVDPTGNSYFLADSGKTIVCMSPSGTPLWNAPVQTALNGAIVIGAGGVLLINGAFSENLFAFGS